MAAGRIIPARCYKAKWSASNDRKLHHMGEESMKLANVFAAKDALGRLGESKLPPKVAYRVLKFAKKFESELAIVDKQRNALIMEVSGAKEGESITLDAGTPQFDEFVAKFNEVLMTDSELALCPLKMDALMDALEAVEGNTLSMQDIALLEVFFESNEEAPPLKVV